MAKQVLINPSIKVGNVDLTDHASSATIEIKNDEVDLSAFGNDYKDTGMGLKDATITVDFFQDFAASSVDATLWPYNESGGTVEVVVQADSTVGLSTTNPKYTMSSRVFNYSPLAGAVGDASTTSVAFRNAGTLGLIRGTS